MPSSHAASIMFSAAWPRSNMIDSGASGRCGSGVTRAIADRRAREVAGERPDRRQRREARAVAADDERPALLVLRAAGAPAGVEDPVEVRGLQRAVGERADRPLVSRSRRQTGSSRGRSGSRHRGSPRGGRVARDAATAASSRPAARPGRACGSRPGCPRRREAGLGVRGSARPATAAAASPAASGVSGPPSARARNDATVRRYAGVLVQPRVLAALDDEGLDRRPAPAGRSARPARAAAASRARWATGTTASSSPWASRIGPR